MNLTLNLLSFSRSRLGPRVLFVVPGLWPSTEGYFLRGRRIKFIVIYVHLRGRRINLVVICVLFGGRRINFAVNYEVLGGRRILFLVNYAPIACREATFPAFMVQKRRKMALQGSSGAPLQPTRAWGNPQKMGPGKRVKIDDSVGEPQKSGVRKARQNRRQRGGTPKKWGPEDGAGGLISSCFTRF